MMLIKGGFLVDPKSGYEGIADILIEKGKIIKIAPEIKEDVINGREDGQVIDAGGKTVAPGLVDVHVHFRDPGFTYKEDIISGARAAVKGGFTTIVLMANTRPTVDNKETLSYVLEKGRKTGIHIETCANITLGMKGQQLTDMEALAKAGAAGFTDDGVPLMEERIVKEAYAKAAELKKPLSFHEENPAYIKNNGINAGKASAYYHIGGSDRQAEIDMVKRDLKLAEGTGAEVSIQHISTREAVELVRQAKKTNPHIHAEATPHHFTLTEEAAILHGTLAKMNPPLREEADRLAIIEGLRDGTIDLIATDHAPHSAEEKEKPITEAPSGIIGLETSLSLGIRELVDKGYLTMTELLKCMALQPAQLYQLDAGYLEEGGPADLVIFDKEETWKADTFLSKSSNTPFKGEVLPGTVYYTICNGEIVYKRKGQEAMEQKKKIKTKVVSQTEIADKIYDMWIETDLAASARAGQFICVYPHNESTLLPRPISICEADREKGRLRIVYRVAGKGTEEFSNYHAGKGIRILGNLGNGFPTGAADGKKVILMGGGIGIPPMLQLAKDLKEECRAMSVTVVAGYRNDQLFLKEDLEKYAKVYVATEDGSAGTKGNVLDVMKAENLEADVIMACGPMPMLRAIKQYAETNHCEAYISLEERMACGVGACLGCVCKTKNKDAHSHVNNARICTDGPVFHAQAVDI